MHKRVRNNAQSALLCVSTVNTREAAGRAEATADDRHSNHKSRSRLKFLARPLNQIESISGGTGVFALMPRSRRRTKPECSSQQSELHINRHDLAYPTPVICLATLRPDSEESDIHLDMQQCHPGGLLAKLCRRIGVNHAPPKV